MKMLHLSPRSPEQKLARFRSKCLGKCQFFIITWNPFRHSNQHICSVEGILCKRLQKFGKQQETTTPNYSVVSLFCLMNSHLLISASRVPFRHCSMPDAKVTSCAFSTGHMTSPFSLKQRRSVKIESISLAAADREVKITPALK
jgi:hypothetical protein